MKWMSFRGADLLSTELLELMQHKLGLVSFNLDTPRCRTCFVDNDLLSDVCSQ